MNIVDAVWEKRNLGVTCYECTVDNDDNILDIKDSLEEINKKEYVVFKVPSGRADIMIALQKEGYTVVEAAIQLSNNLVKFSIPKKLEQIASKISWEVADKDKLELIYTEIDKGIFKTDRIALDPFFKEGQNSYRYKMWMKDIAEKGTPIYNVKYEDKDIGFFYNKEIKTGVFDGIMAGVYSEYEGLGMGVCVQLAGLMMAKENLAKKYLGHVSGNNMAVLKSLDSLGFEVKKIDYILIKHN